MVLPSIISLQGVREVTAQENPPLKLFDITPELNGIGFSRFAIQLISDCLRLPWIWMMDDNIERVYCLDYKAMLSKFPVLDEQHDPKEEFWAPVRFTYALRALQGKVR